MEGPVSGLSKDRTRLGESGHRRVGCQAQGREEMAWGGGGFQLADGGGQPWRNLELPWEKTLDSPSVLASPWTRQGKAPVCGSEFLNLFFSLSLPSSGDF